MKEPRSHTCIDRVCAACADEWRALYRTAVAARGLLDHLERQSRLTVIAATTLSDALEELEDLASCKDGHAQTVADA